MLWLICFIHLDFISLVALSIFYQLIHSIYLYLFISKIDIIQLTVFLDTDTSPSINSVIRKYDVRTLPVQEYNYKIHYS